MGRKAKIWALRIGYESGGVEEEEEEKEEEDNDDD